MGSGRYTARYESDADAPGAGAVILESPDFLTEGESSATVRITPLAGAAVTVEITARAESIGERPVNDADSIPQADRLIIAEVPAYSTNLTVWRATPAHSSVTLTVVEREVEGEMTYFSQSFDPFSTVALCSGVGTCVEGVDKEVLKYKAAANAVVWTGGTGDFAFKVRATRSPALEWEPDEFLVHVRLIERTAVPAQSFVVERASAVGRGLATLSVPGFPGALFSEAADSDDLFSVSSSGEVRLSGASAPAAGARQLIVAATAAFSAGGYKRFYGKVSVTANIVFVSAGGVGFAGEAMAADGDSADVVLKDEYEREIVTVAATYRGKRRGLHWMETAATVNKKDVFSSAYREFAEQLCAAGGASGGKRWRVATIEEVAGVLNSGTGPAVLAENNRFREIPGAASGMRIPLPTAARGGAKNLSGDAFVVSARDRRSSGRVLPVIYEQAASGGGEVGRQ